MEATSDLIRNKIADKIASVSNQKIKKEKRIIKQIKCKKTRYDHKIVNKLVTNDACMKMEHQKIVNLFGNTREILGKRVPKFSTKS